MPQSTSTFGTAPVGPAPSQAGRPSAWMVIALRAAEGHVLVVVGEADLHTAGQLRTELIDRQAARRATLTGG